MKILLMSGSFHSESKSIAILNAVKTYAPEHEYIFPWLDKFPFYCEDLSAKKPNEILELINTVKTCDGIIICTPEYNHSVPAVLKNAIDWLSRPAFNSVLKAKPITIITQASSPVGGARAQAHIKLILDSTLSTIYPCHEMMISGIDNILDNSRKIVDRKIESKLKMHLLGFFEFIG
ncbi:MAG: NAD(P)H-dependent oxidoreductase [Gammaproteobacteria bacterium]|nr:NAD(P)H-dependent oxidoreductase [Gammaproteobacteria bacterium]